MFNVMLAGVVALLFLVLIFGYTTFLFAAKVRERGMIIDNNIEEFNVLDKKYNDELNRVSRLRDEADKLTRKVEREQDKLKDEEGRIYRLERQVETLNSDLSKERESHRVSSKIFGIEKDSLQLQIKEQSSLERKIERLNDEIERLNARHRLALESVATKHQLNDLVKKAEKAVGEEQEVALAKLAELLELAQDEIAIDIDKVRTSKEIATRSNGAEKSSNMNLSASAE